MTVMTADGKEVASGHRVFNFRDWKWGVVDGDSADTAELVYDDGTRSVLNTRWVLSKDPSLPTW